MEIDRHAPAISPGVPSDLGRAGARRRADRRLFDSPTRFPVGSLGGSADRHPRPADPGQHSGMRKEVERRFSDRFTDAFTSDWSERGREAAMSRKRAVALAIGLAAAVLVSV